MAQREHGKLAWHALFDPAITLARDGFVMPPRLAAAIAPMAAESGARVVYFNADGSPKKAGEKIFNPALADTMALIATQGVKAFSHFYLGDLPRARQLFMQVMEYFSEEDFRGEPMPDDGFYAYIFAGYTEWFLGYPERAVRLVNEALSIARRQNNPFLTVFALAVGSWVYDLRRDYRRSFEAGDEAVRLNIVSEFPFINAMGGKRRA